MDYSCRPLVFNVFKPKGLSSFDVIRHFKKNLNFNFGKIGHFGTLDPFAEGVLLVGIQGAQRLNDYVHQLLPKTYWARGIFGIKTNSGDLTGEIISRNDISTQWKSYSLEHMETVFKQHFLGEYWQSPHPVSAVKFQGKSLYQHALEGRVIHKEKVQRHIYSFSIEAIDFPIIDFKVTVSSGTYIRSLFEEFSEFLGGDGHLLELVRTDIGSVNSMSSLSKNNWPIKENSFELSNHAMTIDQLLKFNKIILSNEFSAKFRNGIRLNSADLVWSNEQENLDSNELLWVLNESNDILGLAEITENQLHSKIIWPNLG